MHKLHKTKQKEKIKVEKGGKKHTKPMNNATEKRLYVDCSL